jgi:coenzyme PQQ synthesis protein D (PqqD)
VKLSIPDGVVYETVEDEVVLLSLTGGMYYKLNGSGRRIWSLIAEHGDLEKVQEAMVREFAADPDEIRRDVAALVDDLRAHDLVLVEP